MVMLSTRTAMSMLSQMAVSRGAWGGPNAPTVAAPQFTPETDSAWLGALVLQLHVLRLKLPPHCERARKGVRQAHLDRVSALMRHQPIGVQLSSMVISFPERIHHLRVEAIEDEDCVIG